MFFNKRKKEVLNTDAHMDRDDFNSAINSLLDDAESIIPNEDLPQLPFMKDAPDVHDWYDFEHRLWEKGEEIRELIVKEHKELNNEQSNRVCSICLNKNAKRGRQSFVLLLGKKRYIEYASQIADLLSDDDVDGHAIDTLYKMGTTEYQELIKPFLNHNRSWIRDEAKRYINKCN